MNWYDELRHLWWYKDSLSPDDERVKSYYKTKYSIAEKINPDVILEIGVRFGYSAFAFLSACPGAKYIGIDADNGKHGGVKKLFPFLAEHTLHSFQDKCSFYTMDTQDANTRRYIKELFQDNSVKSKCAMVHIDGDHTYTGALNDIQLVESMGCKHILVDDYFYVEDVFNAANEAIRLFEKRGVIETTDVIFDGYRGNMLITLKEER